MSWLTPEAWKVKMSFGSYQVGALAADFISDAKASQKNPKLSDPYCNLFPP
jgi:hypothetical protein